MTKVSKERPRATVTIFPNSCKGVEDCGICIMVCPRGLFIKSDQLNDAGHVPPMLTDEDRCTGCENCMRYCPDFAIYVSSRE